MFLFPFSFLLFFFHVFHLTVISFVKYLLCSTVYTLPGLFTKNLQPATWLHINNYPKIIKPGLLLSSVIFPSLTSKTLCIS